jgi:hypothetical protein
VSNLHFAYLLVPRAVVKAGPLLAGFDYDTGLPDQDRATRELVNSLVVGGDGRRGGGGGRGHLGRAAPGRPTAGQASLAFGPPCEPGRLVF